MARQQGACADGGSAAGERAEPARRRRALAAAAPSRPARAMRRRGRAARAGAEPMLAICSRRPLLLLKGFAVGSFVDRGDLFHPTLALLVVKRHHDFLRPMKVIGDEGYFPVQRGQGVAYDPPGLFISSANS